MCLLEACQEVKFMKVYLEKEQKELELDFKDNTVKELLKQININSETVIIVRDNEVLTLDDNIENKDNIKLLSVISGG
jgi:sulfur carrier protein